MSCWGRATFPIALVEVGAQGELRRPFVRRARGGAQARGAGRSLALFLVDLVVRFTAMFPHDSTCFAVDFNAGSYIKSAKVATLSKVPLKTEERGGVG